MTARGDLSVATGAGADGCGKRVAVIGAGISGLVTAKVFLEDGFDPIVFEKEAELGGVWASTRTYPGLHANNPRETYAFSDFPYPESADDFPSAAQVRDYLGAYAERFGVRARIRLGTEVLAVVPRPIGWDVRVRRTDGCEETERFDFVVVCNGVFSEPVIPAVAGMDRFTGRIMHSSAATDPDLCAGRRVVVVGGGKSALDCATAASRDAASCTLVFRRAHWMVPRYPMGLRVDWMLFTRFASALLPYHSGGMQHRLLHGPGRAAVRAWWRVQTAVLRRVARVPAVLTPDRPLPAGIENVAIVSDTFDRVRAGHIRPVRGAIRRFVGGTTIELESGERIEADLVIFATGWRQGAPFLDARVRAQIERDGMLRLYRLILPPGVPRLGFVGYNSSIACQLSSELGAHWLAAHFRGDMALPDRAAMERAIDRVLAWLAAVMPDRRAGYFIGPAIIPYVDELLRDMGLSPRRERYLLAEYFGRVWPSRYATVGAERRRARSEAVAVASRGAALWRAVHSSHGAVSSAAGA